MNFVYFSKGNKIETLFCRLSSVGKTHAVAVSESLMGTAGLGGVLKSICDESSTLSVFEDPQPLVCSTIYQVNLHPSADGGQGSESLSAFLLAPRQCSL